jgi:hypothetical protein
MLRARRGSVGGVDVTFWVIQAVLLTPVLFMAASAGAQPPRERDNLASGTPPGSGPEAKRRGARGPGPVAVAIAGLSQFSVEQQARLVILRTFVQEAKMGRGALTDDVVPDQTSSGSDSAGPASVSPRVKRPANRLLLLACAVVLMLVGLIGVARTSMAIDDLQRSAISPVVPLSPMERFLPGVLENPTKYLSAVNGGGSAASIAGRGDGLYAVNIMHQKEAMDRWEAMVGIGFSVLLFLGASRSSEEEASVGADVAPFALVIAVLFGALSFFELP